MSNAKFIYLSTPQVLAIHDQMIKRFGGSFGIRDLGLIESAVSRPQASFNGQDLYPNLFSKAASLPQSLLKNHAFVDGNKRTALTASGVFLRLNGSVLNNSHKKEVKFAVEVDNQNLALEQIAKWLEEHSKPT